MPAATLRRLCAAILSVAAISLGSSVPVLASGHGIRNPAPVLASTARPAAATPTAVSTPLPTPTDPPTPVSTRPKPKPTKSPTLHPTKTPHPKPTKTPHPKPTVRPKPTKPHPKPTKPSPRPTKTPRPKSTKQPHPKPTARPHAKATPTKTSGATKGRPNPGSGKKPSSKKKNVPPVPVHPRRPGAETTLDVENTIQPIDCSGKATAIRKPFLLPPYHGFVQLFSYFDHDYPDFAQDGVITLANGLTVTSPGRSASRFAVASDFPAYWSDSLRTYVYYDGHNGYDYGLVYQPIYSVAAGKVIFAAWNLPGLPDHGYGQMVMIDHGRGYVSLYGHLSKIQVHAGEHVKAGQQIGISGNTGHSSGPHLHFTVFHDCKPTDPYGWTGSGPDPLAQYQPIANSPGESSAYLWLTPPQVLDPYPHFPGTQGEQAPPGPEILNLTLPSASNLSSLLSSLDFERSAVGKALSRHHIHAHYDATAAAFTLTSGVRPAELYSLPYSASVTPNTPPDLYVSRGSFADRLALLIDTVRPKTTVVGGRWQAFLFHYHGRTYLLGRGIANQNLEFLVQHSATFNPMITVSNGGGAFAVPMAAQLPPGDRIVLLTDGNRYVLGPPHIHPKKHPGHRFVRRHRYHKSGRPSASNTPPVGSNPSSGTGVGAGITPSHSQSTPKPGDPSSQAGWAMIPVFMLVGAILLFGWWMRPRKQETPARRPAHDLT